LTDRSGRILTPLIDRDHFPTELFRMAFANDPTMQHIIISP
jgi:hypothetical protein